MLRRFRLCFAALGFALASAGAAQHEGHAGKLGTVVFPNSGKPTAQAPFLRGVALLHSFEYQPAARAFREAQATDPGFALAYWGEALTYSHVLWREENLAASRAALHRLAATPAERLARAGTGPERSFGAVVEAFYADGSLPDRVRAYADAMRRHVQAAAGDPEAAAFAAHALMLAANLSTAERATLTREAIELAQRVARRNPDHPGAVHYLIHLYDTPGMAALGLAFARAYDRIAPAAEHALHMPSHIYLQLGLWEEVVNSNERPWAASRAEPGRADWHAFAWLQYAYLRQGRWADARGLIDSARVLTRGPSDSYVDARYIVARLEFQYAADTGKWQQPIGLPGVGSGPVSDRERGFGVFARYWRAIDAAQRGDPGLGSVAAPFLAIADSVRTGTFGPERSAVQASNALVVGALVARSRGDRPGYLASLRAAAELEQKLTAFVGPPERVFALELLGEELIAEGRAPEAVTAYGDVLKLCPNRSRALLGLARAKAAAGDQAGADEATATLHANWKRADPDALALTKRGS
ncbi:MAG: hypothetical protein ACT4PM_15490 [Gemmatimonadales bacterium]